MSAFLVGEKVSRYRVMEQLGAGGMGIVYLARDERLQREVALKILPADAVADEVARKRFQREALSLAQLAHGNVAALYDFDSEGTLDFLVMEYVKGEPLNKQSRRPFVERELLELGIQLADGLAAAHERGVIHRDIKPANLILTSGGRLKILDFGLARLNPASESASANAVTTTHAVAGTPPYMAPEQLRGEDADARTDIWSVGVVLYELAAGQRPFRGQTGAALSDAILHDTPERPHALNPTISDALDGAIAKCLEKDPATRFQSAKHLGADLRRILSDSASGGAVAGIASARSAPSVGATWHRWKSRPVTLVAALALVLATGAIAVRKAGRTGRVEPAFRYELVPPAGYTVVSVAFGSVALSPDAARLAMVLSRGEGRVIAVRDLTSEQTAILRGTEGGSFPFWSPDGTRLGFFADRKLKTIDVGSSAVQVLGDAGQARGGAWTDRGVIVFAALTDGALYKIGETGGRAVQVTRPPSGWSHRHPSFLTGSDEFVFSAAEKISGESRVLAGSLTEKGEKLIAENAAHPSLSGRHLLFVRNGNLLAQPFDSARLAMTGPPKAVADRVEYFAPRSLANYSCAGGKVAFVRANLGTPHQLVLYDRAGTTKNLPAPPADYLVLAISPDGNTVAAMTGHLTGDAGISLVQTSRGSASRLTWDHQFSTFTAAFSPDGKQLAYAAAFGPHTSIILQSLSSPASEAILDIPAFVSIRGWSRDGKYLIISHQSTHTDHDVGFIDMTSRKIVLLAHSPAPEFGPALSPNQKWLAYASVESGTIQVYVTSFPSGAGKWQVTVDGGFAPQWSNDGKELFYLHDGQLYRVAVTAGTQPEFHTAEALFPVTLPYDGSNSPVYVLTPDGRFLMPKPAGDRPSRPVHVITNWTNLLPRDSSGF